MNNDKDQEINPGNPRQDLQGGEASERTGSTEHNDYKVSDVPKENTEKERDEKESYVDYNGNSEANNPARAE